MCWSSFDDLSPTRQMTRTLKIMIHFPKWLQVLAILQRQSLPWKIKQGKCSPNYLTVLYALTMQLSYRLLLAHLAFQ